MTAVPSHCGAGFETEAGDKYISYISKMSTCHMYFKTVQGLNERLVIWLLNGPFKLYFYPLVDLICFKAIRL